MRIATPSTWFVALILVGLVLPAWVGLGGHPDIDIRARPLRSQAGCIRREAPPGQLFQCAEAGLEKIDVALVPLSSRSSEIDLVLREDGPQGEILRRASVLPSMQEGQEHVTFAFDPLPDSKGRWYHFQLLPGSGLPSAGHSPWVRFHGWVGHDQPWGTEVLEASVVEGQFVSHSADLRAVALSCEALSTTKGSVRFKLFDLGSEGELRRDLELPVPLEIENGYAFFSFPAITGSQGRIYGYHIKATSPARFVTRGSSPTLKTYHGVEGPTPRLGGMTTGELSLPDRDLVFRAWSSSSRVAAFERLEERAGWWLWAAVACWVLSVLLLVRGVVRSGGARTPDRPDH